MKLKNILIGLCISSLMFFFTGCSLFEQPAPQPAAPNEIHFDGDTYTSFYMSAGTSYEVAVRFNSVKLAPSSGKYIQKVKFYLVNVPTGLTVNVYNALAFNTPGSLLTSVAVNVSKLTKNSWNEVTLPISPMAGMSDIWLSLGVTVDVNTTVVVGIDKGPAFIDGDFIYTTSWTHLSIMGIDGNFNIRAITN